VVIEVVLHIGRIKRAKSKIEKDGALAGLRMNSYRTYVRCYHRISRNFGEAADLDFCDA
jgi:hypothetical protein